MRLKNMYLKCRDALAVLENIKYTEEKVESGHINRIISNYDEVYNALNELEKISCLSSIVCELRTSATHSFLKDIFFIYAGESGKYSALLSKLCEKVRTIVDLGDSVGFSKIEHGFDIKLPPNTSFADMSKCISDIDKVFSQCPYLNVDGESIEFETVDVGSTWLSFLTICTGSTLLLLNLAKIVDKCVAITSHIVMVKKQMKQLRQLDVDTALVDSMSEGFKTMHSALVDRCLSELNKGIGEVAPEDNERLRLSLNLLSDWMSKGMEIHASLESSSEIRDLFPTAEKQEYLSKEIELLAEHTTDSE